MSPSTWVKTIPDLKAWTSSYWSSNLCLCQTVNNMGSACWVFSGLPLPASLLRGRWCMLGIFWPLDICIPASLLKQLDILPSHFPQIVLVFLFLFFKWTIHYSLPAHSSEEIGLLFLQRIPPPPFKNRRDLFNFQLCMYVVVGGRKGTLKGRCLWRPEEPGPLELGLLAIISRPRGCWDPNSGLAQWTTNPRASFPGPQETLKTTIKAV